MKPIPVILDTNCLVSALIFSRGHMTWLRFAWQSGCISPLVCKETVDELIRVFAYPKFKLPPQEINDLLAEFLPWATVVELQEPASEVQHLRDIDDAVFIHLARQTGASYLVSGDRHLLELKERCKDIAIVSPAEFHEVVTEINLQ